MIRVVAKIARAQIRDALRSKSIVVYALFFLLLTEGLLRFAATDSQALLNIATATFLVVPLVSVILTTIAVYNAREFIELLLAQPIRRSSLYAGLYVGLATPLAASFVVGVAAPALLHGADAVQWATGVAVLGIGVALTLIFAGIGLYVALRTDDRLRGLGISLGIWLLAAIAYDGIVLGVVAMFSEYPIERPLLALTFANPIDLARVIVLLRLDVAALMGYTGAVFQRFFGGAAGVALAVGALVLWIAAPFGLGARRFNRKDF
jgi:Cu-processing system permease protein